MCAVLLGPVARGGGDGEAAAPVTTPVAVSPRRSVIEHAVTLLRSDPNLGSATTKRQLRWNDEPDQKIKPKDSANDWLVQWLGYLTSGARALVWAAGVVIAAFIAIWIWRLVQTRQISTRIAAARLTTHVDGLDIRPDSLPNDIGARALALLDEGNTRAALSLLYRGSLSRAVHRFAVVIGESFTESEALGAVTARLDPAKTGYFAALVGTWQSTVYGALEPTRESVAELCRRFAGTFDAGAA